MHLHFFHDIENPDQKRSVDDMINRETSNEETTDFLPIEIANIDVEENDNGQMDLYIYTNDHHWYGVISFDELEQLNDAVALYQGCRTRKRIRDLLYPVKASRDVDWYVELIDDQDLMVPMYRDMSDEQIMSDFNRCMKYREGL